MSSQNTRRSQLVKYFGFILSCFVSDEPFQGWGAEIGAAGIQLVFLNSAVFGITVLFDQPLACYIGMPVVTTILAICKTWRWSKTLSEVSVRKQILEMSEITFAQALANPEMAKDLISGYKLGPRDPGGEDYLSHIANQDLELLKQIGSINSEWMVWVGANLVKEVIWLKASEDKFLEFVSSVDWRQVLLMLRRIRPSEDRYHGYSSEHPAVVRFWALVKTAKRILCLANPDDSSKICSSEPRNYLGDDYLLGIIRSEHSCAVSLTSWDPEIAVRAAELAPEHAEEIAHLVPSKAVQIASRVPQAFQ